MYSKSNRVRIVCVSDTHNHSPGEGYKLPAGDVLIHAGDLTNQGNLRELQKASEWLRKAPFAVKLVVAGNHDLGLDADYSLKHIAGWTVTPDCDAQMTKRLLDEIPGLHYLQHSAYEVTIPGKGVSFQVFGSPYSPDRGSQNWAFQYEPEAAEKLWSAVPNETDILITHSPPAGHCDASDHWKEGGCVALQAMLARVRPALHVCGHCHEGRGSEVLRWGDKDDPDVHDGESGREAGRSVWTWIDQSQGTRKQSSLDLTGVRGGWALMSGRETAIVNASIMARSWTASGHGKEFNKPIVVDVEFGQEGRKED